MARSLDRRSQLALMLGARPSSPPGLNLAPVGQEPAQHIHLLIVDLGRLVSTKDAVLATPSSEPTPTATASRLGSSS